MGILVPLALALLALALPIIALHLLRHRHPTVTVSSVLLWEAVLTEREAGSPWQRRPLTPLLLLQLLVLVALVLALARPFQALSGEATGNTVIVLDGSASMRATDVAPSRFERARAEARALVERLGVGQRLALVLAGPAAELRSAPTADVAALRDALDRLEPGAGLANWSEALALADATARRLPGGQILVITDGAFLPPDPARLDAPTRFIPVGGGAANLGITGLTSQRTPGGLAVFVRVRNGDTAPARALLTLTAGDRLLDARELAVAGGADAAVTVADLPTTDEVIRADLEIDDALAVDNRAWTVPPAESRVLLVSATPSAFLRRGLSLLPATRLFIAPAPEPGFDWYVFDGLLPERLPGASLLINPAGTGGETAVVSAPRVSRVVSDHPLLAEVDLRRLNLARARPLPAWAGLTPLVEAGLTPLVVAGEHDGQRVVLLGFDLHESDLPLDVAFPILLSNTAGWLHPAGNRPTAEPGAISRAGEPLTLAVDPATDAVVVTRPDGQPVTLAAANGVARLSDTTRLGAYRISPRANGVEGRTGWLVVNLLSDEETAIGPITQPALGGAPVPAAPATELAQHEFWPLLLGLGILLLMAEWWLWFRGRLRLAWLPTRRVRRVKGRGGEGWV